MEIRFLGVSICLPDISREAASFVIDNRILVDTGWCNILKMRKYQPELDNIECLVLTHLHQDHYIGLPQILFYLAMKKLQGSNLSCNPFRIIGPSKHLEEVVNKAMEFLQIPRFPELSVNLDIIPLSPGESYTNGNFSLDTFPGKHMSGKAAFEESLVCRYTEAKSRKSICFTGDTSFNPSMIEFVKGVPVLIHDACHSTPKQSATIAKMAKVGKLYLIHYPEADKRKNILEARKIFPDSFLAVEGKIFKV